MHQRVKDIIIFTLHWLGISHLIHFLNRNKVTLLSVHSIMSTASQSEWQPLRAQLDPATLDRNLNRLSKYYNLVPFSTAVALIKGEHPPIPNALAITMDDGYRNNISHGLPIFSKYNLTPIIFVAAGHVNAQRCFWFDRIDYALQQVQSGSITVPFADTSYTFITHTRAKTRKSYAAFRQYCEYRFPNDLDMQKALSNMARIIEIKTGKALSQLNQDPWSSLCRWPQLQDAKQQGRLEVGSHTMEHVRVSRVHKDIAQHELTDSKQTISNKLGSCQYFCYPNGDFNERSEKWVQQAGYEAAVTVIKGLNSQGDNIYQLKRLTFPEQFHAHQLLYTLAVNPLIAQLKINTQKIKTTTVFIFRRVTLYLTTLKS